jgi:hypothetical protein
MQRPRDGSLEAGHYAIKRLVAEFEQPVPVIGHQHPGEQFRVTPGAVRMDELTSDTRSGVIHEDRLAMSGGHRNEVDLSP